MRIAPFRALRASPALAPRVAAPPYDVVTREEAVRLAAGNPWSFLRIARSEIDLPPGTDPHAPGVYARARANLDRLVADGALVREQRPSLYLYRVAAGERAQVGLATCVHVDDYERGVIRTHETTRPDKEDDRTRHALALGAHAEPVLLLYRDCAEIDRLASRELERAPLLDVAATGDARHTVWAVAEPGPWAEAFAAVGRAYVADGHHRSAAAWRAARQLGSGRAPADAIPPGTSAPEHDWFMAVLFPASQLRILPYHRLVRDLGGRPPREVLDRLGRMGEWSPADAPVPPGPGTFCLYLDGRWYRLELPPGSIDRGNPIRSLDVWLLQERVLGPILGIADPRTDPRIDFVGGIRGTGELERRVDSGEAALAISMHPTTVEQLMAAADAGEIMPPKSTWFEPKLASGLLVHPFA
jgi:uncharacterized protein (DUF1015 family)